ncbi:MAG: hypothetical protein C0501_00920 [Isosphaera sp.]|nr:hypothetical protein [Isosphaera sp.]
MLRAIRLTVGALAVLAGGLVLAQPPKGKDTPKEPAKAAASADGYYPLRDKMKWTYRMQDTTIEVAVAKVGEKFSAEYPDCTQVDTLVNGKVVASELYAFKADGVYRVKVKEDKIEPPVKVLQVPVKKDASWEVNSKVGTQTVKGTFRVKAEAEDVDTPAGKFKAVLVEGTDLDVAGTKTTVRTWFVKDKGVVKLSYKVQDASDAVLELTKLDAPAAAN